MSKQVLEVSPRDYHTKLLLNREDIFGKDSWLSKSALYELKNSSLYRWRYAPKVVNPSPAIDWGTIIDCLITTPDEIDRVMALHDYEAFRTNEAKAFKKEAHAKGLALVHRDQLYEALSAVEKIMANETAAKMIENSSKQVILLGQLKGVNFKGLVDIAPDGEDYLCDIKTTGDLTPKAIQKRIADLGYHVQAGIYLKLWNQCFPHDQRNRFRHIWQFQSAPYEVAVTELSGADISAGEEYAAFLLNKLIKATKSRKWPNIYGDKVAMVARPQYAMYQEEEEMDEVIEAPASNRKEVA